nr:DUF4185 domain-containing protein [Flexivirga aerilata]
MLADGGYLYVYGTRSGGTGAVGRALLVARTTFDTIGKRSTWRYWDGRSWVADAASATPVVPSADGVSQSLTVSRFGATYVAVSKVGGDFGDKIGQWRATTPVGPWKLAATVPVAPKQSEAGLSILTYQPLAHPEIPLASGKLLVSMSRLPEELRNLVINPQLGRLRFYEMPRP